MLVLKLGGRILKEDIEDFLRDLEEFIKGDRVVIVHGGSVEVQEVAERMGITQRFITSPSGFRSRYTNREMIGVYQMVVAGKINKDLVSKLQRHGVNAVGLSGMDCRIIKARRKKGVKSVEKGSVRLITDDYTGKIRRVEAKALKNLLSMGYTPVIAPLAMGEEYEALNVDGDRLAASIAGALRAERLIIFTDVQGLLLDGELVERVRMEELERMTDRVGGGMKKKMLAAKEALELGVPEVVICSVLREKPLTSALLGEGCTVMTYD